MDYSLILMGVGIFFIILSFFMKDKSSKIEAELEELSLSLYQETNVLKRRLKIVEEELMLEPNFQVASPKQPSAQATAKSPMATFQQVTAQLQQTQAIPKSPNTVKPINSILVSQVQALHTQGLSMEEISQRSTLSHTQIASILGGRQ